MDDIRNWTDAELIADFRSSTGIYIHEVLEEICRRADMMYEWEAADGETFESVVEQACIILENQ